MTHIVARAGTARNSFYEAFSGREDSFITLVRRASAELVAVVDGAREESDDRIQAALRAVLEWLAGHEALTSVLLVDAATGPPAARQAQLDLYDALAARLARVVHGQHASAATREEMLIGAVASVVQNLLLTNELDRAPELAEELAHLFEHTPHADGHDREVSSVCWRDEGTSGSGATESNLLEMGGMVCVRHLIPSDFGSASPDMAPPEVICSCEHWCYLARGALRYRFDDGETLEVRPGDAFHLRPGHLADVLEDAELIEFTSADQFQNSAAAVARKSACPTADSERLAAHNGE